MEVFIISVLVIAAVVCAVVAAVMWLAWRHSRRANRLLALRLNAEGQVEAATLQTLSAMREAARAYVRRQGP